MKKIIKWLFAKKQSTPKCKDCWHYNKNVKKCFAVLHTEICGVHMNPNDKTCFKFKR